MSYIQLIIINENKIYSFAAHYRTAMKLLDANIIGLLKQFKEQKYIDAGYLLVDFDKNQIINAQSAFPINKINTLNKMEVFDCNFLSNDNS